jgi:hypothetical protein
MRRGSKIRKAIKKKKNGEPSGSCRCLRAGQMHNGLARNLGGPTWACKENAQVQVL